MEENTWGERDVILSTVVAAAMLADSVLQQCNVVNVWNYAPVCELPTWYVNYHGIIIFQFPIFNSY